MRRRGTGMKSIVWVAVFLVAASVCGADVLVTTGDFEGGTYLGRANQVTPINWDSYWNRLDGWGSPSVAYWSASGQNGYVAANVNGTEGGGYAVVFQAPGGVGGLPGEELDVWGIPAGSTVMISADIIDLIAGGGGGGAILKAESWHYGDTAAANAIEVPISGITSNWARHSMTYTITQDADIIRAVVGTSTGWAGANSAPSSYGFDNVSIGFPGGRTPALFPVPRIGLAVAPSVDSIAWTNPDPNEQGSQITCDVWFRESDVELADPNFIAARAGEYKIIENEPINSVTLSAEGIQLKLKKYYYWRVDCHDPSLSSEPVQGFVWSFNTGDVPPTVDAGADQYVWLSMDDGTPGDGRVTVEVTGVVTDDGESDVLTTWSLDYSETDQDTSVVIADAAARTTTVTIDNTGWFRFLFSAADAIGGDDDVMYVGVYGSACEAAKADPTDKHNNYPDDLTGDINGDCATDLSDLAIVAQTWLDCMSDKLDCAK